MYEQILKIETELTKLDEKENKVHQLITPNNKNYEAKLIKIDKQSEVSSEMHED